MCVVRHLQVRYLRLGNRQVQGFLRLSACRVDGRRRRGQLHPEVRLIKLRLGVQRGIQTRALAVIAPRNAANRLALLVLSEQLVGHVGPTARAYAILPLGRHLAAVGLRLRVLHIRG